MIETIFIAISLGVILAFTIGPVFFILIETSITKGIRSALAFDIGAISGDIFFIVLAYWGTSKLSVYIENNPNLFLYGGLLIIVYGLFSFFKERRDFRLNPPQARIVAIKEGNYFSYYCYLFCSPWYDSNTCIIFLSYYITDLPLDRYSKDSYSQALTSSPHSYSHS